MYKTEIVVCYCDDKFYVFFVYVCVCGLWDDEISYVTNKKYIYIYFQERRLDQ
jgi:hypothetical protein